MRPRRTGKWRWPKPADLAVLRRAAEGGYFDDLVRKPSTWPREAERLAAELVEKPARLYYAPNETVDWHWELFYPKKRP